MKKFFLKPGLEFVFSMSLVVIIGLPPVLMAQNTKDVEIKIINGDTTVNGKNIKDLSALDRKNALQDIKHIEGDKSQDVYFLKKDTLGGKTRRFELRKRLQQNGDHQPMITENMIVTDSAGKVTIIRGRRGTRDSAFAFRLRTPEIRPGGAGFGSGSSGGPRMMGERKNSQSFDYTTVDNEGITTRIRFHVSEVSNEDLKRMPHVEGGKFEISDLNVVPEFSSGKTLIIFDLPEKTLAEVKLIDSNGKILWNDKTTSGSFTKTFVMGLNGIYYLQIKQGNNIAIKRIMKEE